MKKSKFLSFLDRYFLAGNTDSAKLIVKDKVLSTDFISTDQNVIGSVKYKDFDTQNVELGVYTTSQLIKMLTALNDDLEISYNQVDDKAYSVLFNDKDVKVTYMLSDLSIIRQVPNLKTLPDFDVKIKLTKEFASKFIKSKNAIPDSDNFAVECKNDETKVIINFSSISTNRITYKVDTTESKDLSPVCFSAKLFKEILVANSDCEGLLEISTKGLARVTFSNQEFESTYYLVKLTVS